MDLAKLIEPFRYKINIKTKLTCDGDKHEVHYADECKNMLELILFARYNYFYIADIVGDELYKLHRIEDYSSLISQMLPIFYVEYTSADLEKLDEYHPDTKYIDFGTLFVYDQGKTCYEKPFIVYNYYGDKYILVVRDNNGKLFIVSEINYWQANYVTIFNIIYDISKKTKRPISLYDYRNMLPEPPDYYDYRGNNCTDKVKQRCDINIFRYDNNKWLSIEKSDECSYESPRCKDTSIDEDILTSEDAPQPSQRRRSTPKNIKKMAETPREDTNYQKLLCERDTNIFETSTAIAEIRKSNGTQIAVSIGTNVLVFNTDREFSVNETSDDLSSFVTDDIKIITVRGDESYFAYDGFKYRNIIYKITNSPHITMYAYITTKGTNIDKISSDLIELARNIEKEVANLPEYKFCADAVIEYNNYVKITHGPNIIHTYIDDICKNAVGRIGCNPDPTNIINASEYIESQTLIGRYDNGWYVFLKIGKLMYKTIRIFEDAAAYVLLDQHLHV